MKIDQNFDKKLSDHVCKNGRRTLCLSLRGTQVVLSGEENCVNLALENKEEMTVGELMEAIQVIGSEEEDEEMRFKTSEQVVFPPFRVKFKGRLWTTSKAREELGIILSILGFGKGGSRRFNKAADEPAGWPDEHSFEAFEHPSYASKKVANEILESLFTHYGMDPYSHPFTLEEPATPPRKKRKTKALNNQDKTVDDPNDNSVQEEVDTEEEPVVNEVKRRKLGAYEIIRERNIAEREELARNLGIMPHSKDF